MRAAAYGSLFVLSGYVATGATQSPSRVRATSPNDRRDLAVLWLNVSPGNSGWFWRMFWSSASSAGDNCCMDSPWHHRACAAMAEF